MDRDDQIGADLVGEGGALLVAGSVVRPAGEEGLHPKRREPALEPAGEIPAEVGLGDLAVRIVGIGDVDGAPVVATVPGIDDDALARR